MAATIGLTVGLGLYYIGFAAGVFWLLGTFTGPNNPKAASASSSSPSAAAAAAPGASEGKEEKEEAPAPPRDDGADIEAPPPALASASAKKWGKMSFLEAIVEEEAGRPNPFMSLTWAIPPAHRVQMALLAPVLLPVRTVLLFGSLFGGVAFSSLATWGADLNAPLAGWRHALQRPVAFFARGVLFALGYHWIHVEGKLADSGDAPILVSNHLSFADPIFLAGCCLSMGISLEENARIPIFGALIRQCTCLKLEFGLCLSCVLYVWTTPLTKHPPNTPKSQCNASSSRAPTRTPGPRSPPRSSGASRRSAGSGAGGCWSSRRSVEIDGSGWCGDC